MTLWARQGKRRHDMVTGRIPARRKRRVSEAGGVGRRAGDTPLLNSTEQLVLAALTDRLVTAVEIAGLTEITVHQCRRALATLRGRGLAEAQRSGSRNVWKAS